MRNNLRLKIIVTGLIACLGAPAGAQDASDDARAAASAPAGPLFAGIGNAASRNFAATIDPDHDRLYGSIFARNDADTDILAFGDTTGRTRDIAHLRKLAIMRMRMRHTVGRHLAYTATGESWTDVMRQLGDGTERAETRAPLPYQAATGMESWQNVRVSGSILHLEPAETRLATDGSPAMTEEDAVMVSALGMADLLALNGY